MLATPGLAASDQAPRSVAASGVGAKKSLAARRRARAGMVMVAPATALVAVFFGVPIGLVIWMSFNNWPLIGKISFIGLSNYADVFHDGIFAKSLLFTAEFTLIMTPIQLVGGYLMAMLVRNRRRGVGVFRTIYFVPVVVGTAAGAYAFFVMVQPETGVVNAVLRGVGLTSGYPQWLVRPGLALGVVVVFTVWKTLGTAMILYMVGMQAVPTELYDASQVDGANAWQREILVTVPLLRRTIALVLLLTIVGSFLVFDPFYILTQGGPNYSTLTAVLWVYTAGFVNYRLGYAAALSVVLMALLIVVSVGEFLVLRPSRGEEA
jgi:multiple sugar transport system permease protein